MALSLRKFARLTWGIDTRKLKTLNKVSFVPTLLYSCSVWAKALRFSWCKKALRDTQKSMTRLIARGFNRVSAPALLIISNLLPADYHALQITTLRYVTSRNLAFSPSSLKAITHILKDLNLNSTALLASSVKNSVVEYLIGKWDAEWKTLKVASITREFFPSPRDASHLNRAFISHEYTQILSGHCILNHRLAKMKIILSADCKCGAPEETLQHFLFDCPLFSSSRMILERTARLFQLSLPIPLSDFSKHHRLFHALLQYVRESGRLSLRNIIS